MWQLTLKRALAAIILVLSFAAPVAAHPVSDAKDGLAAYASRDYATALRLFHSLADQGNGIAQYKLGIIYFNGEGVTQNHAEAMKWFRKAAVTRSYGKPAGSGDASQNPDPFANFNTQATEINYKTAYETATELSAPAHAGAAGGEQDERERAGRDLDAGAQGRLHRGLGRGRTGAAQWRQCGAAGDKIFAAVGAGAFRRMDPGAGRQRRLCRRARRFR
jgi:hypothetical protein